MPDEEKRISAFPLNDEGKIDSARFSLTPVEGTITRDEKVLGSADSSSAAHTLGE
jgi:hypothetical protein